MQLKRHAAQMTEKMYCVTELGDLVSCDAYVLNILTLGSNLLPDRLFVS